MEDRADLQALRKKVASGKEENECYGGTNKADGKIGRYHGTERYIALL